ncbi:hypothetical protein K2173_027012 [Erythroxylum novogranatense]|uniref:Pentatricopeptide repeat-containing protein n=1 Tax=Erythroxylum novogranatense TaxID=1862640 RepID=A0AAV8TXY2_9ROSI|nr:hypothetical protein K2173_027012 [Erythroxylum novogranatense]
MLSPFAFSRRITGWVILKASLCSISRKGNIKINPQIDQCLSNTADFESKIHFLKYNPYPDSLIKVLQSTTDVNSAVNLFKWASIHKLFDQTADTYYWMITKLGMAGKVKEISDFCENMVKDGCAGVENTFLLLIYTFVRRGRMNEATQILVNMVKAGYRPSVDVFNFLLGALQDGRRGFEEMLFVYKEMVKAGVAPGVDTLNYLLGVLFQTERVDTALDQYMRMNKKGCNPNSKTFEIVIQGLISNNRANEAVAILQEMFDLGCQPDLSFYSSIIPMFCREQKMEDGIRLFKMMRTSDLVPDSLVYGALLQCLCNNRCLESSVALFEEMIENGLTPPDTVFVDLVNGFCERRKVSDAIKLLEDNDVLLTSPYNALLTHCCNADNFHIAKCLHEKMMERNLNNCHSWNILIRWLCEKADIRHAYELLGRMIISSSIPDSATYSALVLGNCRLIKHRDVLKLFLQLRAKCWDIGSLSYSEMIKAFCRAQKFSESIDVFKYMSENRYSLHHSLFNMLIKGICDYGMVDEAVTLQLLAYNSGTYCANETYNYIMVSLATSKRGKDLLAFLSRMLVEGCRPDGEAYCTVIQSMVSQNRVKESSWFFNRMVNEGLIPDSDTLYKILLYLGNECQLSLISAAVHKLTSHCEILDSGMYNILVKGLWKEDKKAEACQLLDLMLDKGWMPDATTHKSLIGSVDMNQKDEETLTIRDNIGDILTEGLGEVKSVSCMGR